MKLSIIVVNHNMRTWLRQCINALTKACHGIDCEIIVVDNASADRSLGMLRTEFPNVRLISNEVNAGLTAAYNQAIKVSYGEYVLLVNADILTSRDTLSKIVNFMDDHSAAGGASVRMVNPQGYFISSSKYGISSAWSALIKWTGLAKYFKKSHITPRKNEWTDEFETAEVDVLNGGFMMLRRSAINVTGPLDERFVMFGYNIDLSFRLKLEGFKNYYFPKTYVINFDVQRYPKLSWRYIKYFYGAMFSFVSKYLFKAPTVTLGGAPSAYLPQPQYDSQV